MVENYLAAELSSRFEMRMVSMIRFVLAFFALFIVFLHPTEPVRFIFQTYLALIFYTLYSATIYIFAHYEKQIIKPFFKYSHWADALWCLLLIYLTNGTSSIFYFFLFFVILNASFSNGYLTGLKVTLVSAVGLTLIGFSENEFELGGFLLRITCLIALGYLMSFRGGYEIRTGRRLSLLRDISMLSNPRFGINRTIDLNLELLRSFYEADGCLLIMKDAETDDYIFRRSYRNNPETAMQPCSLSPQFTQNFFSLPENYAVIYQKRKYPFFARLKRLYVFNLPDRKSRPEKAETFDVIAEKLDANSFLTVPVYYRKVPSGRIFVFSRRFCLFDQTDLDFLLQAVNQLTAIIENIQLVDHLASNAAEQELKKIVRDIHDSIIQSYIGLQIGIDSLVQISNEKEDIKHKDSKKKKILKDHIDRLGKLGEKGMEDLRKYVHGLSHGIGSEGGLMPAINRYSEKFTKATGINVEIRVEDKIQITDPLAAEIFQIITEALSNVRRHTDSPSAFIEVVTGKDKITLAIGNNKNDNAYINFSPQSIAERVESLGGFLQIEQPDKKTVIRLEIPL
jgi:signal transduction histidine kinase